MGLSGIIVGLRRIIVGLSGVIVGLGLSGVIMMLSSGT